MGNEFFGKRIVEALNGKIDSVFLYTSLHDLRFRKKIEKIDIIHFIGSPTVSLHGVLTLLRLKSWEKKSLFIGLEPTHGSQLIRFCQKLAEIKRRSINILVAP